MNTDIVVNALSGGALIGLSAVFLMLTLGRISGISGITSGFLSLDFSRVGWWRGAFLAGLLIGPLAYRAIGGEIPEVVLEQSAWYLIVGGLLVGFGATLGSGCTSGHGVCGIARVSPRSLAATAVFLITAIITVLLSR